MFFRSEESVSASAFIVRIAPEMSNQPEAETFVLSGQHLFLHILESFGKLYGGGVPIIGAVRLFRAEAWLQQVYEDGRIVLHLRSVCQLAQAGRGFRAIGMLAYALAIRDWGSVVFTHIQMYLRFSRLSDVILQDVPNRKNVAHRASEHKEVEDGVHVFPLVEGVEESTCHVTGSFADNPPYGFGTYRIHQRLESNQYDEAHQYITDGFEVAMLFQFAEAHDGAGDGA